MGFTFLMDANNSKDFYNYIMGMKQTLVSHWKIKINSGILLFPDTLESGINVAPWINVAPGKFGKKNKHSPIYTLYLYSTLSI
jgi:hypothetical protein